MARWLIGLVLLMPSIVWAQPKCDNVTDDTAAIQALFNTAAARCVTGGYDSSVQEAQGLAVLPSAGVCRVTGPLTLNAACAGFDGNGATIWNSNASSPAMVVTTAQNSYSTVAIRNLKLVGKGAVGLQINGNHLEFENLHVYSFVTDVQLGNYAYNIHFGAPWLFDAVTDFSCPSGLTDSGEQIEFEDGSLFNSTYGIKNYGCHVGMRGTSIDAMSGLPVDNEYAQFIAHDVHFEMRGSLPGAFIKNVGCQTYSHVDIANSEFYSDNNTGGPVIENDSNTTCGNGNAFAKIRDSFFSGFKANSTIIGTNPAQVALCGNTNGSGGGTMNNIPNVNCP